MTKAVVELLGVLLFVGLSSGLSVVRPIYGSRFAHKRMTDGNPFYGHLHTSFDGFNLLYAND